MFSISVHPDKRNIDKHWVYHKNYRLFVTQSLKKLASAMQESVWCHSIFMHGKRSAQSFLACQLVVLDFDQGFPLALAMQELEKYQFICGTTKSHQVYKDGRSCDRYRIVLFFQQNLTDDIQTKQNLHYIVTKLNAFFKEKYAERIKLYCQKTNQVFKTWQAIDISSSDLAKKWVPFKVIVALNEGQLLPVRDKVVPRFQSSTLTNQSFKYQYFQKLDIPTDGNSYTTFCTECRQLGGDNKGQNLSVRFSDGQYFYRCHKDKSHRIKE